MAISKRNKRKITVDGKVFYWTYKLQKDILRLTVMAEEKTHSRLICNFKYKNLLLYFIELVKEDESYDGKFLLITEGVLTPFVVRQVIDYGIANGWRPDKKGTDFTVEEIESRIDINFWTETTSATRQLAGQTQ